MDPKTIIFRKTQVLSKEIIKDDSKYRTCLRTNFKDLRYFIDKINNDCDKIYQYNLSIENKDCFEVASTLDNPCVLNLANANIIGGGVEWTICNTQEENLCRRSTLYQSLTHVKYPMMTDEIFYSPNVKVFLDIDYKKCNWYDVSVITAAAKQDPKVNKDGNLDKREVDELEIIIFNIISTAILHGHKNLVLGAIGCGVFNNPPREVAKVFKRILLHGDHLIKYFDNVIFAIYEGDYNPIGSAFKKEFEL